MQYVWVKNVLVQRTFISCWVTIGEQHWVEGMLCVRMTVVSQNTALFDYYCVEKSLVAFTFVRGQYEEAVYALKMLSVMV